MRVPWDSALVVSAVDTVLSVAQVCASMLPGQVGTGLALPPFPFPSPQFQKCGCLPVSGAGQSPQVLGEGSCFLDCRLPEE